MADLLDIAPSTAVRSVTIRGTSVDVRGLNANDCALIAARFPHLGGLFAGGAAAAVPQLLKDLGPAVGSVLAAGCGHLGEEKYEQYAGTELVLDEQAILLEAIWTLTFPNGISSFTDRMARLLGVADEGAKVKIRLKKSPSPSQPSSDAASPLTMQ